MKTQSLQTLLYQNFNWHPSRINSFAELIFGVIASRTVKLKELALHVNSKGAIRARIAKVERLLFKQHIDFTIIGIIIIKLLCMVCTVTIAIDRTNWQFGKNNLNFFVAAIVYGNISIPIAWLLLDKKGNSDTKERQDLIEQVLKIVPKEKIEIILADREFIGEEWFKYLIETKKIPFAIRVKKSEQMRHPNGGKVKFSKYFASMGKGEMRSEKTRIYGMHVLVTCLQLEKEQLIVASNVTIGEKALIQYKQRWSIERSFKALKTSGFNIEDTHITDYKKLRKLFAVVSIALTICVVAGEIKNETIPILIKKHGRKLYSLFTYGFDWLKDYLSGNRNNDINRLIDKLIYRIWQAI